jgi:flagellar hook-basal body complex protein FliE
MLPLSSIRPTMPGLATTPALRAEGVSAGTKIPLAELQSLTSGAPGSAAPLSDLRPVSGDLTPGAASATSGGDAFSSVLGRLVNEVNAKQAAANEAVSDLQSGQNVSLHQAVVAMEEASVSFQLMVEIRNRLLESYQELMRMQI